MKTTKGISRAGLALAFMAAAVFGPGRVGAQAPDGTDRVRGTMVSGIPSIATDTVEVLYRQARTALTEREYRRAAEMFERLRQEYASSGYVADAHYFEALARSRIGTRTEALRAREVLARQLAAHPESATAEQARTLAARLEATLARRGDVDAARRVEMQARLQAEQVRAARVAEGVARAAEQTNARASAVAAERAAAATAEAAEVAAGRALGAQVACGAEAEVRAVALNALSELDPARIDPLLRDILTEEGPCTRPLKEMAVMILARRIDEGDVEALDLLRELALSTEDDRLLETVAFILAESGSDGAFETLLTLIERGSVGEDFEEGVFFAMARTGRPEAREYLERRLLQGDVPAGSRETLVYALAELGSDESLRRIYSRLEDPELRAAVVWSIGRNDPAPPQAWLVERAFDPSEATEVRTAALFRAADAGLPADRILDLFRSAEDPELREQALFALTRSAGDAPTDRTVEALIEIVRSEADPDLRQMALHALTRIDDPRVTALLAELARGGGGG